MITLIRAHLSVIQLPKVKELEGTGLVLGEGGGGRGKGRSQ